MKHSKEERNKVSLVFKEPEWREIFNKTFEKTSFGVGQKYIKKFKEWCMPEQPDGYIRAKKHGLL